MKALSLIMATLFVVSILHVDDAEAWGKRRGSSWGFKKKRGSSWGFKKRKKSRSYRSKKKAAPTKKTTTAKKTTKTTPKKVTKTIPTKKSPSTSMANKLNTNKSSGVVSSKSRYTRTVTRTEYRTLPQRSSGFSDFLTGSLIGMGAYYLFFDSASGEQVDYGYCEANPDACRAEKKNANEVQLAQTNNNGVITDFSTGSDLTPEGESQTAADEGSL